MNPFVAIFILSIEINPEKMQQPLWGIDLGGTKIEGAILPSLVKPEPLLRIRVNTESQLGYGHILKQIHLLVEEMKTQSGLIPATIGIGTPGAMEPSTGLMKNCNSTALIGKPFKKDIEALLQMPVIIANDANCFALAETHWGAVKQRFPGARMVFGIIMGTGVGGGIVIDGKVWDGHHGIGGEWGHNFLDASGGKCYCGRDGCVETVISGPALEKYYLGLTGNSFKLHEIYAAALAGKDAAASKTMERLCYFFGKAVSVVTNILDPDIIVVGGGVGNIDLIYKDGVESLKQFIFNPIVTVPVLKPELGDSAGVFGAAALVA
jgi:predicted NBD/HSP70 family sugar kinase